jgi:uroporphyrinogen III methyltransferase/synthase
MPGVSHTPPRVFLVGAGPGDPGLLTLRADQLIRGCDCVVYDYLVNPVLLDRVPATAERVYVGKRGHSDSITQDEINAKLVELGRRHRQVVRLKGGDPFLFGRGGEEADALAENGIAFAVVPGVTSGIAVPAYAGIPITHRAASSAVVFATGHQQPGKDNEPHWQALAKIETIVLYMGMQKLGELCEALVRHGRGPDTPVCVIQWGTYARQRSAEGTLATIAGIAAAAGLGAPAITVVGDVVRYRERIRWFDNRPLTGRTVAVTRSREQASELATLLGEAGARVIEFPLLRQAPPDDWGPIDAAFADPRSHDWIAFTSANAVRTCLGRLRDLGRDARALAGCRIAAVGAATARALADHGILADLVPASFNAAELAKELLRAAAGRPRILLPQADNAAPALRDALTAGGATVTAVTAYRNLAETPAIELSAEAVDAVTFASSNTAERFTAAVGPGGLAALRANGCRWFAIGPETAATLQRLGLAPHVTATRADVAALAEAVIAALSADA